MFVCTFYSFKGGVGRSLALMNVAASLVKKGRRVLVVDFDLEAPGLTTFAACTAARGKPGLVEFITHYRANRTVPSAKDFIYGCQFAADGALRDAQGSLSIMPAGNVQDNRYATMFAQLDWRVLYEEEDGFLLFEELRVQWEEADFDYVLIDSRTGHTDISGICTRQLPDAVTMLFFPNEQNLAGLRQIVADVRSEPSVDEPILTHFVASRVPRLDDEDEILSSWMTRFQNELGYSHGSLSTLHHYDSLALLDQTIFVESRSKSQFAKELGSLAAKIATLNFEDPDGAAQFLHDQTSQNPDRTANAVDAGDASATFVSKRLDRITEAHKNDFVVMFLVAYYYFNRSLFSEAVKAAEESFSSLGQTRTSGYLLENVTNALHVTRMKAYRELGNVKRSCSAALDVLSLKGITDTSLRDALTTLAINEPTQLPRFESIAAVAGLDDQSVLATIFSLSSFDELVSYVGEAFTWFIDRAELSALGNDDKLNISLGLIASGAFRPALQLIDSVQSPSDFESVAFAFNSGMAEWGLNKEPTVETFGRVLALVDQFEIDLGSYEANFYQCLALASHVVGKKTQALALVRRAIGIVELAQSPMFSCWSYREQSAAVFIEECNALEQFIGGDGSGPVVLLQAWNGPDLFQN